MDENKLIWTDKPRNFLKWSINFTRFYLYPNKLIVQRGLLVREEDEVLLYRIIDKKLTETLLDRILHLGTIVLYTIDTNQRTIVLKSIPNFKKVSKAITYLVNENRNLYGIQGKEMFGSITN